MGIFKTGKEQEAREENVEFTYKGSQLKTKKKIMYIQCKVCMLKFSEVKCREHAQADHPKSDVEACFPHLKK